MFGLDFLFAPKYEKEALSNTPEGWATGCFWEIAGDSIPFTKKSLDRGAPVFRSAGLWEDNHKYGDSHIKKIVKMSKELQKIAIRNPQAKIEISCFCEHLLSNPDKYHNIVKNEAPDCFPVNTPWKGSLSKKYKNEIHGAAKKLSGPYNFSYDGTNCVDTDVQMYKNVHSSADIFFFWHCRFNLKWSMKDSTPRPERKALPSSDLIKSIIYLHKTKETFQIPKNWLIKSHAEKHNATDLKGDKLLIISPYKTSEIVLKKGSKTYKLPYYGTYEGGGHRYYYKDFAYKLGANLEVWQGGKSYGVIEPAFRGPTYR